MAEQRIGLPFATLVVSPQHWLAHLSRWRSRRRDQGFDRRFGVDTYAALDASDKGGLPVEAREFGTHYSPTPIGLFVRIVRSAAVDRREFNFVDLGAGKGRALLLASKLGFRSVLGVEADPRLARIARSNIDQWIARRPGPAPALAETDAQHASFPDGHLFVFMFNPFEGALFDRVAERLRAAAAERGRAVIVAYHNDVCSDSLERTGVFRRVRVRPIRLWSRSTASIFYNELAWKMRLRSRVGRWFNLDQI